MANEGKNWKWLFQNIVLSSLQFIFSLLCFPNGSYVVWTYPYPVDRLRYYFKECAGLCIQNLLQRDQQGYCYKFKDMKGEFGKNVAELTNSIDHCMCR